MGEFRVVTPRIGANDDYVTIGSWLVKNGAYIQKGQEIVSLETTKETVELEAACDGYLFYQTESGREVEVGTEIAVIADHADYRFTNDSDHGNDLDRAENPKITRKASALIEKHHIDISRFDASSVIREKDVLRLLHGEESTGESVRRSRANDVIIVTGGGFSKMCVDLLRLNKAYNIHGILDDSIPAGTEVLGVKVLGKTDLLRDMRKNGYMTAVNALGSISSDNRSEQFHLRKNLFNKIKEAGFFLPALLHPSAQIAPSSQIGEGAIVMEHAVIGPNAVIGDNVIVNTGAVISHDCVIGSHARISPGALLAGDVKVGENALIGMGVTAYLGIRIGKNAVVSNGQNLFKDVREREVIR